MVQLGNNTAAGTGTITINPNGRLQSGADAVILANDLHIVSSQFNDALILVRPNETLTLNGNIGGNGRLTYQNGGTLVLNGQNSFNGLRVEGGTLRLGSNTAAGSGQITLGQVGGRAELRLQSGGANVTIANDILIGGGSRIIDARRDEVFTLNGTISGFAEPRPPRAGQIVKTGRGTLVLNGSNTLNGLTIVEGVVALGSNTAAGVGMIRLTGLSSTLASRGTNISLSNDISFVESSRVLVSTGETLTLNGALSGASSILINGGGTLVLDGFRNTTSGLIINEGIVRIGSQAAVGNGLIEIGSRGILQSGASDVVLTNNLFMYDTSVSTNFSTFDVQNNGTLSLAGRLNARNFIFKTGEGMLFLNNSSIRIEAGIGIEGGIGVFGGTLRIVGNLGRATGNISLRAGTTLQSGGPTTTVDGDVHLSDRAGQNVPRGEVKIDIRPSEVLTLNGVLSGTATLNKTGTGTLVLGGENTSSRDMVITAGAVIGSASSLRFRNILNNGALRVDQNTAGTLSAVLSGNGLLTKSGAGSLVLSAISPFSGQTVIDEGKLVVTGSLAQSSVRVRSGAILGGNGRVGRLIVERGGLVAPGLSPGTLTAQLVGVSGGNALAVASALDQSVTGGYNPQGLFALYNQGTNLSAALGQVSGELHSSTRRALLQEARVVRDAAFDRLNTDISVFADEAAVSQDGDTVVTAWQRVAQTSGTARSDGVGSRFSSDQTAILVGLDVAGNGFRAGAMFHYGESELDLDGTDNARLSSAGGAVYAGWRQDNGLSIGVGGSLAGDTMRATRAVRFPGLDQTLSSRVSSTTYQLFGEAAYDLAAADSIGVTPSVRLAQTRVASGNLVETGGTAALSGASQSAELTQVTAGLRGSLTSRTAQLIGAASWQRSNGDRDAATRLGFPSGSAPARIAASALDRDMLALEMQARIAVTSKVTIGAGYSGLIGQSTQEHGARATLTIGF